MVAVCLCVSHASVSVGLTPCLSSDYWLQFHVALCTVSKKFSQTFPSCSRGWLRSRTVEMLWETPHHIIIKLIRQTFRLISKKH